MSNDEKLDLILEQVQNIARDRIWNNKHFEFQSKITGANISKILNPKTNPKVAERTRDALSENSEGAKEQW